ncbi:unnamed protein product [Closterium sp. NIES-53]
MQRPEPRLVSDILEPNRLPAPVTSPDHPSQYQQNVPGKPRQALPTLVAYEEARGFKMEGELPGPGMIYDVRKGRWEEPTANEREAAMGHLWGATAHPEVTERQRRVALGRAMDVNVMMWLIVTIRIQLKARDMQRDIVLSERVREHEAAAQHRRVLEEMEERYEERVEEGYAYLAMLEEAGEGEEGKQADEAEKKGETERKPKDEWQMGEGLRGTMAAAMQEVLRQHREAFAHTLQELGKCNSQEMCIELMTELPLYQRKRRMSLGDLDICLEKCAELLAVGLFQRSESDYAAATVVASRKDLTGEVSARRMCGDYRGLNKVTVADRYAMQSAEEIFDKLQGAKVFSTLDLRQGFNQIPIRPEDRKKTAFHSPNGLYEWKFMPFGMKNASALFQQTMDAILRGVPATACYIDDVTVFSPNA